MSVPLSSRRGRLRLLAAVGLVVVMVGATPHLSTWTTDLVGRALLTASGSVTPAVERLDRLPATTSVVARDGTVLAELNDAEHREPVELDELPEHVPRAVLAAEDQHFHRHSGVDLAAVGRATLRTLQGDTQGGSTITQQLAKLNHTGSDRTLVRKARELLYAVQLEREFSKEELLERYLNQVYFGDGAYGFQAAAEAYFDAPARSLDPAQAAVLAAMIRAPEHFDPRERPESVVARRDRVLRAMHEQGWLSAEELERALARSLDLAPPSRAPSVAPHFVEYVKREAVGLDELGATAEVRRKELLTGGYTIETTLDVAAFRAAERAVSEHLGEDGDPGSAVVSVVPGDGAIRVLFGGRDFEHQKFDVATQARRQPGSAFKPFVYLAMLREGIHPSTRVNGGSPRTFEFDGREFEVGNYSRRGYGWIDADDGLVRSVNTVFMDLGLEVGPEEVVDAARDAGIDEEILPVPAVSLGGIHPGASPLQMATAYATFASGGVRATPYAVERILDRDGEVVYERTVERERVFEATEIGVLNDVLMDVVSWGTGTAAALDGRDVAGKTGTTSEYRDAWFVGYVPQLATAVWTGHLDNSPMDDVHGFRVTGGSFPAVIFGDAMRAMLEGVEPLPLPLASSEDLDLERLWNWSPPSTSPTTSPPEPEEETTTTQAEETTTTTGAGDETTTTGGGETTTTRAEETTTTTAAESDEETTTTQADETTTTEAGSSDGG